MTGLRFPIRAALGALLDLADAAAAVISNAWKVEPDCSSLLRLLTLVLSSAVCGGVLGAQSPIGIFTTHSDVGRATGSAAYDAKQQTYLVAGSGQNMWIRATTFTSSGNGSAATSSSRHGRASSARMERASEDRLDHSPLARSAQRACDRGIARQRLDVAPVPSQNSGPTEETRSAASLPDADAVIQLERRDGEYFMSVAQFGDTLVTTRLAGVALPDTVYVGLFVCSHNDSVTERAAFSNVRITTPPKHDFVPYRDYIGSNLEILDVQTGNATIVHQYTGSFQAPNWTHDGKALIYVQEGRLYRFDLSSRSPPRSIRDSRRATITTTSVV